MSIFFTKFIVLIKFFYLLNFTILSVQKPEGIVILTNQNATA
jgi:hypothetical protein